MLALGIGLGGAKTVSWRIAFQNQAKRPKRKNRIKFYRATWEIT